MKGKIYVYRKRITAMDRDVMAFPLSLVVWKEKERMMTEREIYKIFKWIVEKAKDLYQDGDLCLLDFHPDNIYLCYSEERQWDIEFKSLEYSYKASKSVCSVKPLPPKKNTGFIAPEANIWMTSTPVGCYSATFNLCSLLFWMIHGRSYYEVSFNRYRSPVFFGSPEENIYHTGVEEKFDQILRRGLMLNSGQRFQDFNQLLSML